MSMSMVETYDEDAEEEVGFRFNPSDDELIINYLQPKVAAKPNHDLKLEDKNDIYKIEPWQLHHTETYDFFEHNEWFYFVNRTQLSEEDTQKHSKRKVSGGYWKSTGKLLDVKTRDTDALIGKKRKLSFYMKGDPEATGWTMTEYYLIDESSQHQVLCHLKAPKQ